MASESPGSSKSSRISTSSTTPNTQCTQQRRPPIIVSSETESEPETIRKAQVTSGPGASSPTLEPENANSVSQPSSLKTDLSTASEDLEEWVRIEQDWGSASEPDDAGSGFESGDSGRIRGNSGFTPLEEIVTAAVPTPPPLSDEDSESSLDSQHDGYVDSGGDEHGGDDGGGEEEHYEPAEEASPRAYSLGLTYDNGDHGITDPSQAGETAPQITEDDVYRKSKAGFSLPNTPTSEALGSSSDASDSTENTEEESDQKPAPKRGTPGRRRGQQIDRFNPEYVTELNDAIFSANSQELCSNGLGVLRGSWVVGSWWNHTEKHKFFNLIARIGRHDVLALANHMKTKSIVECRTYLKLLNQAVVEANENLLYKGGRLPRMTDIPAAVEISDECAEALEEEAQLLENRTVADEQRREKNKWGKFWLLDNNTSEHIEDLYERYEDGTNEEGLEKIKSWQTLGDQPPSIRYTAFIDIHTLVVGFTRKLVSASIFMAHSRLRSTNSRILRSSKESDVRPSDVEAATNTLGLAPNMKEYWAKVPRRLSLDVLESRFYILDGRKNVLTPLDEVERFMRSEETFRTRPAAKEKLGASDQEGSAQEGGKEEGTTHADSEVEGENDNSDNSTQTPVFANSNQTSSPPSDSDSDDDGTLRDEDGKEGDDFIILNPDVDHEPNKIRKRLDREYQVYADQEESYLESRDQRDSQEEERRLWQLLGKQLERPILEGLPKVLAMPKGRRKRPADIHDWTDDVEYYAPWETNKKRRIENVGVITSESTPRTVLRSGSATSVGPGGKREEEEGSSKNSGPRLKAISKTEGVRLSKLARAPRSPSFSSGYTSALESIPTESSDEETDYEPEGGAS
ncbi:unnamed protein product [Tuber melanosporum]|uniref:(Perigord truffle) hypothetical protein n=1 Tax=Tuber melanosporum (strain Mel28) TaxID=656061 RepID=D5G6M5_TUBMM|nr:uncharacterized protein GSTUM_00002131001 [Tuber melanosporum]CAZ80168.1 unnamed protein product [Tuber melanosporum]